MKHPGDIIYFLKYVGLDVLIVAVAVVIVIIGAAWYFLGRKKKGDIDLE